MIAIVTLDDVCCFVLERSKLTEQSDQQWRGFLKDMTREIAGRVMGSIASVVAIGECRIPSRQIIVKRMIQHAIYEEMTTIMSRRMFVIKQYDWISSDVTLALVAVEVFFESASSSRSRTSTRISHHDERINSKRNMLSKDTRPCRSSGMHETLEELTASYRSGTRDVVLTS